jgi:hypothetical protein
MAGLVRKVSSMVDTRNISHCHLSRSSVAHNHDPYLLSSPSHMSNHTVYAKDVVPCKLSRRGMTLPARLIMHQRLCVRKATCACEIS